MGESDNPAFVLQIDLACDRCGYNLRGLRRDSQCPECGNPILSSIRTTTLHTSDPVRVQTMAVGAALISLACFGWAIYSALFTEPASRIALLWALGKMLWCAYGVMTVGVWFFATRESDRPAEAGAMTKRWARVLAIAELCSVTVTTTGTDEVLKQFLMFGEAAIMIAGVLVLLRVARRNAERLRDFRLMRHYPFVVAAGLAWTITSSALPALDEILFRGGPSVLDIPEPLQSGIFIGASLYFAFYFRWMHRSLSSAAMLSRDSWQVPSLTPNVATMSDSDRSAS